MRRYEFAGAILLSLLFCMLFGGMVQFAEAKDSEEFILTQIRMSRVDGDGVMIALADPQTATVDVWIDAGSYHYYYSTRSSGTGYYGHFTASGGIDFFICDQENFDLWTSGYTASVYERHPSAGSADWEFVIPSTGTWYVMYDNTGDWVYQKHVTGYHRIDQTGPVIDLNVNDGDTCSGMTEISITATDATFGMNQIWLQVDGVLADSSYGSTLNYDWNTQAFDDGEHTLTVVATDNVGNSDSITITVNVSNVNYAALGAIGLAGVAIVAVVVVLAVKRRPSGPMTSSAPVYPGPHLGDTPTEVVEQEPPPVETQPVAAFCPFCGSPRDPPGANFCKNCGGKMGD